MAEMVKSAAATELASKQQHGKGTEIMGGALDRRVVAQLFKKWARSDDRVKVSDIGINHQHNQGHCCLLIC